MTAQSEWRPIPGYPGYEVSDEGVVRSCSRKDARGRQRHTLTLRPRVGRRGHLYVALYSGGVRRDVGVHHLVLEAFIGPRPAGFDACHWNDLPGDNRVANLRWDTRAANVADSMRNGTHRMADVTACPQGHPYTPENTYAYPSGARACRQCRAAYREQHREERRLKGREYMRRRRAEAKQSREDV